MAGMKASIINPAPALRFQNDMIAPNMPIGAATTPIIKGKNTDISFGRAVIAGKNGINREAITPKIVLISLPFMVNLPMCFFGLFVLDDFLSGL
jgi:hypothetical protein